MDAAARANLDPGLAAGVEKAFDDRRRAVGDRKHAAVILGLQGDAARGEPVDGLGGAPAVERAEKLASAAGIALDQFAGIEAGVGDVAPPAAADGHLAQRAATLLEYDHRSVRRGLARGEGAEDPGRSASDDHVHAVPYLRLTRTWPVRETSAILGPWIPGPGDDG